MKTKLLFTAALMAAAGMATQNVYAVQGLVSAASVSAMVAAEEENVEADPVSDDVTDYTSYVKNASCSVDNEVGLDWWKPDTNASANNIVNNDESKKRAGVEYWQDSPITKNTYVIKQTVQGLPAGQYRITAKVLARVLGAEDKGVYLKGNDKQVAVTGTSGDWNDVELVCDVTETGVLELGLYAGEANESDWMVLSDVHVYRLNTKESLDLTIAAANAIKSSVGVESDSYVQAIAAAENVGADLSATDYKTAIDALLAAIDTYLGENSSVDSPYDMTNRITNPDFTEATNKSKNNTTTFAHGWHRTWTGNAPAKNGSLVEYWNNTFEHSQELSDLPNGKYKVEVLARHFGTGGYLFATSSLDSQTANISKSTMSGTTIGNGNLGTEANDLQTEINEGRSDSRISLEVVVTDGKLKIGMKSDATGSWVVFRDFHLYYEGIDVTALQDVRAALVAEAETVVEGTITSAAYTALQSVIESAKRANTAAELTSANNNLRGAIDTAKDIATLYAAFKALKSDANFARFLSETTASSESKSAIDAALSASVEDVESVKGLDDAIATLKEAQATYIANVTGLAEGVAKTDVTFLVQQTDFTGNRTAWTREAVSPGNLGFMNPNAKDLGRDIRFIESYINTGDVPANANKVLVRQNLTGMPNGAYTFEATAFNRRAWFGEQEEPNAIYLYINEGSKAVNSTVFSETLSSVEGYVLNGTVEFGLKSGEDFNTDWNGLADVHLYYEGSAVVLDENDAIAPEEGTYNKVEVRRVLKAGNWNTFCVPFDMTADQLAANGITEVRVLSDANVVDDHATLAFTPVTAIEAGKPYIVKANATSTLTVDGVVIKPATSVEKGITVKGITMKGNYVSQDVPDGAFFISDNAFYLADTKVSLKGFRAYIEASAAAGVNRMLIDIDGVTTSVEDVLGSDVLGESQMVDVYSLSGVKLKGGVKASEALEGLPKGIYVVGGKKVIK